MTTNVAVKGQKSVAVFTDHMDSDLPDHIKSFSPKVRRNWIYEYNYHVQENGDPIAASQYADQYTRVSLADIQATSTKKERSTSRNPADDDDDDSAPDEEAEEANTNKKKKPVAVKKESSSGVKSYLASFLAKAKAALGSDDEEVFKPWVFHKDENGDLRVTVFYSNIFKDKHKEIISEAAHKEYEAWVEQSKEYPELHLWHAGPDSKWGQVDFIGYTDGFAVASAVVDRGKEHIAEALAKEPNLKVSHSFFGLKDATGTFLIYRPYEISPLPNNAEGNVWTGYPHWSKELTMAFSSAKKAWLNKIGVADEQITLMETTAKGLSDTLKPVVEWKGADDPTDETTTAGFITKEMHSLATAMTSLAKNVNTVVEGNKELIARIDKVEKAFEKSVGEAASDLVASRAGAASGATKPTDGEGVKLTKEQAKELEGAFSKDASGVDFLDSMLMGAGLIEAKTAVGS